MKQEEREHAVTRLLENKKKSNKYNFFGNDCHQAIDAMVIVIVNELNNDQIYDQFEGKDKYQLEAALNALEFLRGNLELKEILYPEKIIKY